MPLAAYLKWNFQFKCQNYLRYTVILESMGVVRQESGLADWPMAPPPDSISSALIVCALIDVLLRSIGHNDSSIVGHLWPLATTQCTILGISM